MIELYNDPEDGQNLLPDELKTRRESIAKFYCPENKISGCETTSCDAEHEIVKGKYRLVVSSYKTEPGFGNITKGEVFCGEKLITTVQRNYGDFWYYFVINHPKTGHDYLLCGEDYQGYNVINLSTGENRVYIPKSALEGFGWCIIDVVFDEETCELSADGCVWACPYQTIRFDFSSPDQLPLPVLDVEDEEDEEEL